MQELRKPDLEKANCSLPAGSHLQLEEALTLPDWNLHCVDYNNLFISLEMDLKQLLQWDLPVFCFPCASLPLVWKKKRNDPSFGLFNCLEKVQTLNLPLEGHFFFPCVPSVLGKFGTHWSFCTWIRVKNNMLLNKMQWKHECAQRYCLIPMAALQCASKCSVSRCGCQESVQLHTRVFTLCLCRMMVWK